MEPISRANKVGSGPIFGGMAINITVNGSKAECVGQA